MLHSESLLKEIFEQSQLDGLTINRRKEVSKIMSAIKNKTAEDYYYAAAIYNRSDDLHDSKLAYEYATEAKKLINEYDDSALARKIRKEYFAYDGSQSTPGKPQEYGTTSPTKEDAKIKPRPIICGNCGEEGHFAWACIRPSKPKK